MSSRRLSDTERRDWVRLVRTPQIGPLTFNRLIARYGNATAALEALLDIASRVAKGRRIALPPVAATSGLPRCPRRSSASTRAISSATENGFVT